MIFGRVELDHVCLTLAAIGMPRGVGAGHAVFARVVLAAERVVGGCDHHVGAPGAAGRLLREFSLGREQAQVGGLGVRGGAAGVEWLRLRQLATGAGHFSCRVNSGRNR